MSTGRDEALTESAGRIADGRDDEWEAALAAGGPPEGRERLRRVADIARAWRALGVRAEDDGAPDDGVLLRWGELEAREKLGEGSFGEVFRAWDPSLDREVALKLRRGGGEESVVRGLLSEARRLARVRHPNVLVVHGADVHDGRAGLWTELVHGETLEALLPSRGPLGAPEAAAIGLDLCRALAAVHAAGLVHGDLKAGNVMRERGGRIVLMDFGSGRELRAGAASGPLTGTPLAVAPEALAAGPVGPAADLYSLGALLFRLVTGRHPVEAASLAELREKHRRGERESLRAARPDLPSAFVTAVERALEREPQRRWPDAGAFEGALAATLAPVAGAGRPRPRRRAAVMLPAVAAGVLALAALAVWPRLAGRRAGPAGDAPAPASGVAAPPVAAARAVPPASPTAPPQAAAAPAVEATLWRARGQERAMLEDGAEVVAGDHLFLDFRGAEPLFVYVLDEDEQGETFALFPVTGTDLANPLPAGVALRLPGRRGDEPFDWVVTSAGGREHVLLVASRRRLAVLEDLVAALTPAGAGREVRYARVPDDALATLRGIGGMAPAPAGTARRSRLAELGASLGANRDAGLWVRQLVLQSR